MNVDAHIHYGVITAFFSGDLFLRGGGLVMKGIDTNTTAFIYYVLLQWITK